MPRKEAGENIDSFWDIGDMLPPRRADKPRESLSPAQRARSEKASAEHTRPVEISVCEPAERGASIPPRREEKPDRKQPISEYAPKGGFIEKVTVYPWPTEFGFYSKFRNDALRLFDKSHAPCDYVYFFSYMPQYDQMNLSQTAYYLFWREEVRKGHYLKTDNSYLFLYIYEIINLPDRVPPAKGAEILAGLWLAYRDSFRYLDKYIGEWLCDYCLIHGIEPPLSLLSGIAGEISGRVSLPEFYLRAEEMTPAFLASLSSYDYRKSKYYAEHREAFDEHIPAGAAYAIRQCVFGKLKEHGITVMRITRDSFSGAVACHDVKCKIAIAYSPLRHSYEMRQAVTGIVKLCENQLRAAFSVKSRFTPADIDGETAAAVAEYFDIHYPDRFMGRKKKEAVEEAYMALYEPMNKGTADIGRALQIERDAWETAALLDGDDGEAAADTADEPMQHETVPTQTAGEPIQCETEPMQTEVSPLEADALNDPDGGTEGFLLALGKEGRAALRAAANGRFAAFCKERGRMPPRLKDEIDDLAAMRLGDVVLCDDYTLLDDYREEIMTALAVFSEE